jgi:WD40 repeat protein
MQTSVLSKWRYAVLAIAFLALNGGSLDLRAQEGCSVPAPSLGAAGANIFNDRQEADLGDAMAEHLQRNFRVSNDEQLTAYLRQIATRLMKHMPATQLPLKLFLVDLSDANAFTFPGGRIYVSPKIVALARNEDELAGVLAHELGHMVTHQGAIKMTRSLDEILDVTRVSDRRDVFDQYHRIIENSWRKPGALRRHPKEEEDRELVADRLALYAIAGSGYSVDAFPDLFDRVAGTAMKTGNWLSDIFGTPNPEAKRLREMIKTLATIPEGCIDRAPKATGEYFKTWQTAVVDFSGWNSQEALHGVLNKTKLDPPLRGEIRHLKFSRDGKYVLAQDEGNIYVLTRQPFVPLFQIEAPDAAPAQFSPDSNLVVFHNRSLRVETWNIATQKRASAHELIERKGCWQSNLSPDGRILACVEKPTQLDARADLVLFNVASGEEVFRKTSFGPNSMEVYYSVLFMFFQDLDIKAIDRHFIFAEFTPDAQYLLTAYGEEKLLIDLKTVQAVSIPKPLNKQLTGGFAFLGKDRLVSINKSNPDKSHVLAFPSGNVLADVPLGRVDLATATRGDFVMLRPVKDYPLGVLDLAAGKGIFSFKRPAVDIFDQVFVCEERDGELGLHDVRSRQQLARTSLPGGHLGMLRAGAISADWKWLAVSEEGRGAVWDLSSGQRFYHVRGFQGAYFPNTHVIYADFPKFNDVPRSFCQMSLHAEQISTKAEITEEHARQHGQFLVIFKAPGEKQSGEPRTLEIQDVTTGATLWSRYFPKEEPSFSVGSSENRLLLWWQASSATAKDEMQNFPAISEKLSVRKERAEAYFLEVLEARTGKVLGALAIETGSRFGGISDAHCSGDWVTISDNQNRVLLYSLSSGNEVGRYFGNHPVLSSAGGLLCLENESGHIALYDLNSGQDLDHWVFSSPISLREFSPDGKRLFVLTSDQTSYVLDVSASVQSSGHR